MTTTGENVVVTMDNAQEILDAWQTLEYYDGGAEALIAQHGGVGLDVDTVPDVGSKRDDFCEALRYRYGACINLGQSRAVHPSKYDAAQKGGKP